MLKPPVNINDSLRHMKISHDGGDEIVDYHSLTLELNYIHKVLSTLSSGNADVGNKNINKIPELEKRLTNQLKLINRLNTALASVIAKQLNIQPSDIESFDVSVDGSVTLVYKDKLGNKLKYHAPTVEEIV